MKVKILKTGKVEEHNASYATRLIAQGRAKAAAGAPVRTAKAAKAAAQKGTTADGV